MSDEIDDLTNTGEGRGMTRRALLLSLPALAMARRVLGQTQVAPLRVRGLHQATLAVSDLERSLEFYQGLFGLPIQARQGADTLLRIGGGPQFLALTPTQTPRSSLPATRSASQRTKYNRASCARVKL